jgi:hypothetical protein
MDMFKILGSLVTGMLGVFFLIRGKKTQSPKLMILGAVLIVASYYLFS